MKFSVPLRIGWSYVLAAVALLVIPGKGLAQPSELANAVPQNEITATNEPWPGILIHSETRANPPTRLFVAVVNLKTPKLHLRVSRGGADPDGPGKWQTTLLEPSKIALRERFSLVVNGDFFRAHSVEDGEGAKAGYRSGQWSLVQGPAMTDGQCWATNSHSRPCLVVYTNQAVTIETQAIPGPDNWEVISGDALLVKDGAMVAPTRSPVRHPRTAVGLNQTGDQLIILVVDGRKRGVAVGMTYSELAAEMVQKGCWQALNLDGGGSSVLAVRSASADKMMLLNEPTDGRERAVANVLGVAFE